MATESNSSITDSENLDFVPEHASKPIFVNPTRLNDLVSDFNLQINKAELLSSGLQQSVWSGYEGNCLSKRTDHCFSSILMKRSAIHFEKIVILDLLSI